MSEENFHWWPYQNGKICFKKQLLEFNGRVKNQISGTDIVTKFFPPNACIVVEQVLTEFRKTQKHKSVAWFRYTDDVFFIWFYDKEKLRPFLEDLNKFLPNITFT